MKVGNGTNYILKNMSRPFSRRGQIIEMKLLIWSKKQIKFLKENYGRIHNKEISNRIGKSVQAVALKAMSLGLKSNLHRPPTPISNLPTFDLGYICGLIIGDGWLRERRGNYYLCFSSTSKNLIKNFCSALKKISPSLKVNIGFKKFTDKYHHKNPLCVAETSSKLLYHKLYPFKYPSKRGDSFWSIPSCLTSRESKVGFLCGLFDSEGSIVRTKLSHPDFRIASKRKSNLSQVKNLLNSLGISSKIYRYRRINASGLSSNTYCLSIQKSEDVEKFSRLLLKDSNRLSKW